ncbi:MAG: SUMF1/EgtB/PvdO family nonheme iron enzyme, partial [Pseudomonadales bacterium]|nr:SUMF1/EgtB/PvdO family nonheme iron enzyme [Pseudomonadales bacterium]
FDREGDTVVMSMELLDGEPLDDYLKHHSEGVTEEDAWNIIDGICQGLQRAHAAGIVHSDFKPGNIYYTADKVAKVFDFGIARAVSNPGDLSADGEKTVFDAGKLGALTPTYASYEMLTGAEPSKSDDVYAVALVAYELFTGKHPYNRTPADKALEQGLEPEPIPFLKRRHWKALKRGLALKSEDRTPTIDEFYEGMFSEDPPVFRYAAIGVVLLASVTLGLYSYFNQEQIPQELQDLRGQVSSNRDILKRRLNPDAWNFASEEWRGIVDEALNQIKLADLKMQEEFEEPPVEDLDELKMSVLNTYLAKIQNLREAAAEFGDNKEDVQSALDTLAEARQYMDIVKEKRYNVDPARVASQESPLQTAIRLREIQMNDIIEEEQLQAQRDEAARLAAEEEAQRLAAIDQRNTQYFDGLGKLRDIFSSCKDDLSASDLNELGRLVNTMREIYPERYVQDEPGIITAMAGCISSRIGIKKPERAREVKAIAVGYFPESEQIASIQIEDRDPCAARGLEGRGVRNRSWYQDRLSVGGSGPRLVVIPGAGDEVDRFAISRTEITVGEYNQYCEEAGCATLPGPSSLPATHISLAQARDYMAWLSDQSGRDYRLPTAAEWYHAAKTDTGEPLDDNINCTVDSRGVRLGEQLLSTLSGRPNPWGLYNHVGNAREWAIQGDEVLAMGGAHTDPKAECTLDKRVAHSGEADPVTGFRIVREIRGS